MLLVVEQTVAHANVGAPVGWRAEELRLASGVWRTERQTAGIAQFQTHLPLVCARKIVGEVERQIHALVGWTRNFLAEKRLFGLHYRQREPRVASRNKLAKQLHVDTCGIAFAQILSVVSNLQIINIVWVEIAQNLVINLGCELERTVCHSEFVVASQNEMNASLALYLGV